MYEIIVMKAPTTKIGNINPESRHNRIKETIKLMAVGESFIIDGSKNRQMALTIAKRCGYFVSSVNLGDGKYQIYKYK